MKNLFENPICIEDISNIDSYYFSIIHMISCMFKVYGDKKYINTHNICKNKELGTTIPY